MLLWFGTPGLDYMKRRELESEKDRKKLRAELGAPAEIGIALADFNRAVRLPVLDRVGPIQRVFRVRQSWHLYRDGPSRVRRMEIWADETLLHRSADSSLTWRDAQLRNRRLRPMVETSAREKEGGNWRGLTRWVVEEVLEDRPETLKVELRATWSTFPGDKPTWHHSFVAEAPDWNPRLSEPVVPKKKGRGKGQGEEADDADLSTDDEGGGGE
jgi:hypothetical protein